MGLEGSVRMSNFGALSLFVGVVYHTNLYISGLDLLKQMDLDKTFLPFYQMVTT